MSAHGSEEFSHPPIRDNFTNVARQFAAKEKGSGYIREDHIVAIVNGMQETNSRLAQSSGELILLQYHNKEHFVAGIGITNGEGIQITKTPETGTDQIEFGSNAVLLETSIHSEGPENKLTRRSSLAVPEGFPLDFFTPAERGRDLVIGNEEIKRRVRDGGANQVGEIGYLMEQVGVDTDTFLRDYFKVSDTTSESEKRRVESEIRRAIHNYQLAYGSATEFSANDVTEEDVNQIINVQSITFEDGKIAVGNKDLVIGGDMQSDTAELVNRIRSAHSAHQTLYYLSWIGSAVPRGAILGGVEIFYTSHGNVTDTNGEIIGTYIRLNESGGDEQKMIIFMNREKE